MRWAVLLAGGSGSRFWPLSTPHTPKQLLPLSGAGSTARGGGRAPHRPDPARAHPGGGRRRDSPGGSARCSSLPAENYLVEPRAASTAPALIWATWEAQRRDPDAEVLSLHADWAIGDGAAFRRTADSALTTARDPRPPRHRRRGPVPARDRIRLHRPRRPAGRARALRGAVLREARCRHGARSDGGRRALEQRPVRLDRGPAAGRGGAAHTRGGHRSAPPAGRRRRRILRGGHADLDRRRRARAERRGRGRDRSIRLGRRGHLAGAGTGAPQGSERQRRSWARGFLQESHDCIVWSDRDPIVLCGVQDLVVVQANGRILVMPTERAAEMKQLLDALPPEIRDIDP